ncbi:hypothetical protein RND71_031811 [Anisodus tanguticus]|uniref:Uncharacterized protein n=1 Tax=Anisodus tanguticus TaxID=243964 RepID=A0AAE1RDB3_9SOLA|nr:hypothetical protein RND71_031811 [Anisodus tanguticus]
MEEEEDSVRKVECLRGRLLAERVASRNAKEEAHIMGNKFKIHKKLECQESIGSTKSRYENVENNCSEDIENDASQMSTSSQNNENLSAKSSEFDFSKSDANSLNSSVEEEEKNGGNQVDFEEDNPLALVPMDLPKTKQTIDPIVVREVLDALRHAKEKIQTQMQRSQMIKAS